MPTDEALVDRARHGDRAALETLLRRHQPRLYALCRRMTGNDEDGLDATQEALLTIVRRLDRFDGRSSFGTWAYRVATNACLDELRRRKRRPAPAASATNLHAPTGTGGDGAGPLRAVEADHADQLVDRLVVDDALGRLPVEFRAAVVLRDLAGLDYAEIADVLDIPIGTVRSRIARGRRAVADTLADHGNRTHRPARPTPS